MRPLLESEPAVGALSRRCHSVLSIDDNAPPSADAVSRGWIGAPGG